MSNFASWPVSVWSDFVALFCGDPLGEGIARQTYALNTDPTKVVKVEMASESFQNAIEWETWQDLRDSKYAKFPAPCHWISPCGMVLVQSRVQPLTPEHENVRLPSFLSDFKRSNYGLIDGRVVCCDYGTNLAIKHGAYASTRRKPDWWG